MKEREVIKLLAQKLPIGDDCAVIPFRDTNLVLTTDMLHRLADFPKEITAYTIGWRSAAVSLSDIAAMGAEPLAVVVALGAPEFERDSIEELVAGISDCCQKVGAKYVGGDLDRHKELTLVSSALGKADKPILRSGAKLGDLVCITGELGRTAVALRLFELRNSAKANELFRFMPRIAEGLALAKFATSMMDISDGLARSLYQLGEASKVGFKINYQDIPIVAEISELARDEQEILEMGLYAGEDFELLFTIPANKQKLPEMVCTFTVIGEVVRREESIAMQRGGRKVLLEDRGFEH